MEKRDMALIGVAIIICVVICVLSPYIASGDPDGLEKSAEEAGVDESVAISVIEVPFTDYTFEPLSSLGEVGENYMIPPYLEPFFNTNHYKSNTFF